MPKKIPMRQCLGCREMKPKRELIRIVRSPGCESPDGESSKAEVTLDRTGKKPGRGAYICPNAGCLKRAEKSKALTRAFGVAVPPGIMEALADRIDMEDPHGS